MKKLRKGQKLYAIPCLAIEGDLSIKRAANSPPPIPFVDDYARRIKLDWEDGQVGALAVFTNKKIAMRAFRKNKCVGELIVLHI